jgi:hypothetical protein
MVGANVKKEDKIKLYIFNNKIIFLQKITNAPFVIWQ